MKLAVVGCALLSLAVDPACKRDRAEPDDTKVGTATLTGAWWVANDVAIDYIVTTRCERERVCNDTVGLDRHQGDPDVCIRERSGSLHDDLRTGACPGGIDGKQLETCLDTIRQESCTTPVDHIDRLAACRTSALCRP